ncbi:hypothetical protein HN011_008896 [Eciton burchellii]|nr:hypothetical protein HN011_008896 [Eciton burchellii]
MKRPNPNRSSGGSNSRNGSNRDNSGSGRPRCRRLPSKRKRPMKKSFVAPASLANILLSTSTIPQFRPRFQLVHPCTPLRQHSPLPPRRAKRGKRSRRWTQCEGWIERSKGIQMHPRVATEGTGLRPMDMFHDLSA